MDHIGYVIRLHRMGYLRPKPDNTKIRFSNSMFNDIVLEQLKKKVIEYVLGQVEAWLENNNVDITEFGYRHCDMSFLDFPLYIGYAIDGKDEYFLEL